MHELSSREDFDRYIASFTNYERQAVYPYDDSTLKLERMGSLLRDLDNPHASLQAIHIAGSKGKGAVL